MIFQNGVTGADFGPPAARSVPTLSGSSRVWPNHMYANTLLQLMTCGLT